MRNRKTMFSRFTSMLHQSPQSSSRSYTNTLTAGPSGFSSISASTAAGESRTTRPTRPNSLNVPAYGSSDTSSSSRSRPAHSSSTHLFSNIGKTAPVRESDCVYTGRIVRRLCLVLDCVTPHEFSPKFDHLMNLQHYVIARQSLPEMDALTIFYHTVAVVHSLHEVGYTWKLGIRTVMRLSVVCHFTNVEQLLYVMF